MSQTPQGRPPGLPHTQGTTIETAEAEETEEATLRRRFEEVCRELEQMQKKYEQLAQEARVVTGALENAKQRIRGLEGEKAVQQRSYDEPDPTLSPIKYGFEKEVGANYLGNETLSTTLRAMGGLDVMRLKPKADVAADVTLIRSTGEQPLAKAAVRQSMQDAKHVPRDVNELVVVSLDSVCRVDVHGKITPEQRRLAIAALGALYGTKLSDTQHLAQVLSSVCWFFATNTTSYLVPDDISLCVVLDDAVARRTLGEIRQVLFTVTGEGNMRRILRAFADYTRSLLLLNTSYQTKMFRRLRCAEHLRAIAFDFADWCEAPPLTSHENEVVQRIKQYILRKGANYTSVTDTWSSPHVPAPVADLGVSEHEQQ